MCHRHLEIPNQSIRQTQDGVDPVDIIAKSPLPLAGEGQGEGHSHEWIQNLPQTGFREMLIRVSQSL